MLVPWAGSLQQHFCNFRVLGCSLDQQVAYLQSRSAVTSAAAADGRHWLIQFTRCQPVLPAALPRSPAGRRMMFCSEWAAVLGCGCSWLQAWFCRAHYGAHGPRRARSFLVPTSDTTLRGGAEVSAAAGKKQEYEPAPRKAALGSCSKRRPPQACQVPPGPLMAVEMMASLSILQHACKVICIQWLAEPSVRGISRACTWGGLCPRQLPHSPVEEMPGQSADRGGYPLLCRMVHPALTARGQQAAHGEELTKPETKLSIPQHHMLLVQTCCVHPCS